MKLGYYLNELDEKNKLFFPFEITKKIKLILTRGFNGQILCYDEETWELIYEKITSLNNFDPKVRHFTRFFLHGATAIEVLPKHKRLAIPNYLAGYAGVTKTCLICGLIDCFEIWNPNHFVFVGRKGFSYEVHDQLNIIAKYDKNTEKLYKFLRFGYLNFLKDIEPKLNSPKRDLFLCHSSKDKPFVLKLANTLKDNGFVVWYDEWEMLPGDSLITKIQDGIMNSSWFGVVLSKSSVQSKWCQKELNSALSLELEDRDIFIIPIMKEPCEIPVFLKEKLQSRLYNPETYENELNTLIKRLKTPPKKISY